MIIYKKTEETKERWGDKEATVTIKTTVYFFGIPIYSYRYKEAVT